MKPRKTTNDILQRVKEALDCTLTDRASAAGMLRHRDTFDHKGMFGHGLLIAGSREMCGAAILSARGALRSGIGLLDVLVPSCAYAIVQGAVPEAMVKMGQDISYFCGTDSLQLSRYQAVAIGPALGKGSLQEHGLRQLLSQADNNTKIISQADNNTLIMDADALNLISEHPDLMNLLPNTCIFTPHPGEFERLWRAEHNDVIIRSKDPVDSLIDRIERGISFAKEHQVHLIMKGAFTAVLPPDGQCFINTTGNPGMATGGSGDVLTGILLSLSCQGYTPADACRLGVYLHGASGDIAIAGNESAESLTANDLTTHLGLAFKLLSSNQQ